MSFIDLHIDWLRQYVGEATLFDSTLYPSVEKQLGQVSGYLQDTRVALIACSRRPEDWATQKEPWTALGSLIARVEAEFSGRLLIGLEDYQRWLEDPLGMTWGVLGVGGVDSLVRSSQDLDQLPQLFGRGVRVFQLTSGSANLLAGSMANGDDRGLLDLGQEFLARLHELTTSELGPRPLLDLVHLNSRAIDEILDWFEADPSRSARVILVYSHGCLVREENAPPGALSLDQIKRLRALGGVVGLSVSPPDYTSLDQIRRDVETIGSIPFQGRVGPEGIGLGTNFLGVDQTLPGLGHVSEIVSWVQRIFDPATANSLLHGTGRTLIERSLGMV